MRRPLASRASPERSFEAFYRRHAPDVYRYALALLASPADAEEVTQTTFLNAHRAIERGEHPRHPRAWLQAIALNLCRQRFRQAERRPPEVPLTDGDVAEVVPDDDSPTLDDLTRALKHLPSNQRTALVMREFEGRSPAQISAALDVSVSAVETLLFRARRALREQLEGSLTCQEAERAVSLQLDGLLARGERGRLRAHLRECPECVSLARSMRAHSGAMKSLAALPVPSTLAWASGAGSVGIAGGGSILGSLAAKFVVGTIAATALAGTTYEGVTHAPWRASQPSSSGRSAPAVAATPAAARGVSAGLPVVDVRTPTAITAMTRRSQHGAIARAGSTRTRPSPGAAAGAALAASRGDGGSGSGRRGAPAGPGVTRRRPGAARAAAATRKPSTRRPARPTSRANVPRSRSGATAKRATSAAHRRAGAATSQTGSAKPVGSAQSRPAARTRPAKQPPSAPTQQATEPSPENVPPERGGG